MRLGLCHHIEGTDASEGAVALARGRAKAAGLEIAYRVEDANEAELPRSRYDLVLVKQALHHFSRLEHVLDQVRQCLRPGGWLALNEYVGPSRFQWTDLQLSIMNTLLVTLPESLRRVGAAGSPVRQRVERPSPQQVSEHDPSEAVRSSDVLALVEERFEIVARRDAGGTVLAPLLDGMVGGFDPADEKAVALLRLLCETEGLLLAHRVLPSDYVVLMAHPRP